MSDHQLTTRYSLGCRVWFETASDTVYIYATPNALYEWANQPNNRWPCSHLADIDAEVSAQFNAGGLVDLVAFPDDIPCDEFNAWSADVLRDVLPKDHPAYFVTVGQFA